MPSKQILVTGGTGFIGSHTVVELMQAGYEVLILDNLSNSSIRIIDQIEKITNKHPAFIQLDLCDAQRLFQFFAEHPKISGLIHFAAFKAVGESVENPLLYYRNNLYSLINLLEACKTRPMHFIFSSSCTVYGQPTQLPVTEDEPIKKAASPYGNTKQIAEEILEELAAVNPNLHSIALRYFNPVGAHPSALLGELPIGPPQNLVPLMTQTAIGKRKEMMVYGSDYPTPDGTCIRDYIHVVDLAKAHISALRLLEKSNSKEGHRTYNVGTGIGHSVLEVIQTFERVTGVKLNYRMGPRRPGDIEQIYSHTHKAAAELAWETVHNLNDMMHSAWEWEKYIDKNPFWK